MCGIYFFFLDHFPAVSFFSHNFLATTHNMHTSCVHCVFFFSYICYPVPTTNTYRTPDNIWKQKVARINCRGYWEVAYIIEINPLDAAISKQRCT